MLTLLVEDDPVLRLVQLLLDPQAPSERFVAYADYMGHDSPDFEGWCKSVRAQVPALFPSRVVMVAAQEELSHKLPAADILVLESLALGKAELASATKLKLVQQFGCHCPNIDIDECKGRGIPVQTLRRRTNIAVAEHTIALLMALAKRLPFVSGLVTSERLAQAGRTLQPFDRRYTPGANFGRIPEVRALNGASLGVLGLGEIGSEVAALARAFGMRVLYHKRQQLSAQEERRQAVSYCSCDELFARSDFLSIHLPLNATTRGIVNRNALCSMPPAAFLINTSRAEIIDRAALLEFVADKKSGGVALDVLYEEPMQEDDPLLHNDKVLMTPHVGGGSRHNGLADMEQMVIEIWKTVREQFS